MFHYGGYWKSNSIKIRFFIFDITLFQGHSFGNKIRIVRYDFDPYHISLQIPIFNCAVHFGFGFSKSVFMDYKISYLIWKSTPEQRKKWLGSINEVLGDKNG